MPRYFNAPDPNVEVRTLDHNIARGPNRQQSHMDLDGERPKMPYTAKQKRMFEAAKHNPAFARRVGMSHETAVKLSHEAETTRTRPPVKLKRKAKAERS